MRIFLPFANLRAATMLAAAGATLVPLIGPTDYARYFAARWSEAETFINVEHDVVPTRELLDKIWRCPSPLCVTQFADIPNHDPITTWLGCTKISAEFIAAHPIKWGNQLWHDCDSTIWTAYGGDEKPVCTHGVVRHLHYQPDAV